MNPEQIRQAKDMLWCQVASECADQVAARYAGTCCMGATSHAHVPQQDMYIVCMTVSTMMKRGC